MYPDVSGIPGIRTSNGHHVIMSPCYHDRLSGMSPTSPARPQITVSKRQAWAQRSWPVDPTFPVQAPASAKRGSCGRSMMCSGTWAGMFGPCLGQTPENPNHFDPAIGDLRSLSHNNFGGYMTRGKGYSSLALQSSWFPTRPPCQKRTTFRPFFGTLTASLDDSQKRKIEAKGTIEHLGLSKQTGGYPAIPKYHG